jgi:hypothetical protein
MNVEIGKINRKYHLRKEPGKQTIERCRINIYIISRVRGQAIA